MERKDLFNKTINVLVNAYRNDTLEHENCAACAVGNLIAYAKGYKVDTENINWHDSGVKEISPSWTAGFCTNSIGFQSTSKRVYNSNSTVKDEIDSTGYSFEELAAIELAFESSDWHKADDSQFVGLMAVVDCLQKIHMFDEETVKETKELFVIS